MNAWLDRWMRAAAIVAEELASTPEPFEPLAYHVLADIAQTIWVSSSLPIRDAYHRQALSSCLPPATRSGCDLIVTHFRDQFAGSVRAARWLTLLPALAGLFIGAPLLARELEHGTHRLAWTQSLTCPEMNDQVFDAIRSFRARYTDKGPETVP